MKLGVTSSNWFLLVIQTDCDKLKQEHMVQNGYD